MLYYILLLFIKDLSYLNIFKYITFRSMLAMITSLIFILATGEYFIQKLRKYQNEGQPIRLDGPQSHFSKKGTPTMGGILILISITLSTILWADLSNPFIWISLGVISGFGILGFIDDFIKLKYKNSKGISAKVKFLSQIVMSFTATYFISVYMPKDIASSITFPFFKNLVLNAGLLYLLFSAIVITGASNAVNLTDGLDGLAIGPVIIAAACFAIISYLAGNTVFSSYLQIMNIPHSSEITILCSAIIGAGLGFLWFNAPPAQIFMGDVGSLALGSALGVISIMCKHELLLAIIGGLFVIEALSVIIQVFCYKMWRFRPFKMAPIHHHFEKKGWSETKVVVRFWIIAIVFALIGLATLKIR